MSSKSLARGAAAMLAGVLAPVLLPVVAAHAAPPVVIGFASNFDVVDTTDKECHGFEVEIEDINDVNVVYTYHNWRYGSAASKVNTTFASGHTGVRVRYAATYNGSAWSATTSIGGTEHFGISLNALPGAQRYSWLCEDASNPGTLIDYGGSTEGNYYPMPAPPAPRATVVPTPDGEVIRQEMENGEPPEPGEVRPDAVWVHRYAGSSATDVTLDDLMSTDPIVQQTIQNSILDGQFELVDGGASLLDDDPVSASDEASILVVDTYEYTGPYDDSHTPACDGLGGANDCSNFVGATRLARQMFSADIATATTTRPALNVAVSTGPVTSDVGGTVTSGAIPSADPEVGIDCGTSCFTVVDGGTGVTLTANPNPGYHFGGWGGACSGAGLTCTLAVSANTPVSASFLPNDPTVFVADNAIVEGNAGQNRVAKLAVSLSAARTSSTSVSYSTADIDATAGVDYVAKTGTVSIPAGKTSATISVTVTGDAAVEGDESFSVNVNSVSPVTVGLGSAAATATIVDNDTANDPALSIGDAALYEGNAGTQNAVFVLTMTKASLTPTVVTYSTKVGTATASSDYTPKTDAKITIAAGATSAKINIAVKGDGAAEGDETFRVAIDNTGSSGIAVDRDKAIGTIVDDDTLSFTGVGIGDSKIVEGDTTTANASLTVTLDAPRLTNTVVSYKTLALDATAGVDYTTKAASVTILAGKTTATIAIVINGETSLEANEHFVVLLTAAGTVPIHHATGAVTITTNEVA